MKATATVTEKSGYPIFRKVKQDVIVNGFVRDSSLGDLTEPEGHILLYFKYLELNN